jgi:hypothetical protein
MKKPSFMSILGGSVVVSLLCTATVLAGDREDQRGSGAGPTSAPAAGAAPRLSNGRPDMTGVWGPAGEFGEREGLVALEKLYTPEARARMRGLSESDDPLFRCLPYGVPRSILSSPWPFQIVQTPNVTVVLTEYYHAFRVIPTDGVPRPADVLPSYFGDSVARWDGDTLVVDIVGFNDKTWLADARDRPTPTSTGIWLHSDALHIVERWRMVDAQTLEYQAVVEDSQMLTGPWTSPKRTFTRQPFNKIGEGMCFDTTTYDLTRSGGKP